MNRPDKSLLAKLRNTEVDDPLSNVRNSLGEVRHAVGNPMSKTEIQIQVTSTFSNIGFGIVLPAALPIALQTSLPVWLFGLTDFYGGFVKCQNIIPIKPIWNLGSAAGGPFIGIVGRDKNVAAFFSPIVNNGDLFLIYTALIGAFQAECEIIIHCDNVAYGTFLNSFVSDLITIERIRYILPIANINQFINPIIFGNQTLFGNVTTDSIDPRLYILPSDFQQQIADIPINLPISKSVMIGFQLDVFCQQVQMILFVSKVEPLTHRQTKIIRR
jgi:hypothetical protein